jgi:hypothetical protein
MRGSKEDLPVAEDYGEGFISQQVEWGRMIVEIHRQRAGSKVSLPSIVSPHP